MTPAGMLTLRQLADLMPGITLDQVRGMADRGHIHTVNHGFGTMRYVPASEIHRLRSLGFDVLDVRETRNQQDEQEWNATQNDARMNP